MSLQVDQIKGAPQDWEELAGMVKEKLDAGHDDERMFALYGLYLYRSCQPAKE